MMKIPRLKNKVQILMCIPIVLLLLILNHIMRNDSRSWDLAWTRMNEPGMEQSGKSADQTPYTSTINQLEKGNSPIRLQTAELHKYWDKVFSIFDKNRFDLKLPPGEDFILYRSYDGAGTKNSKDALIHRGLISQQTHDEMAKKHTIVLKKLPKTLTEGAYVKDSRGVVILGGGIYSWMAYLSLLALRDTGSKLPFELVFPLIQEYEEDSDLCNNELPKLNAKCVIIPSVLGARVTNKFKFDGYQFKSLAIITSSFQHVILLDSDNFLVEKPDAIFDSEVYKKHGLITWPDYWARTISPYFYSIARIKVHENIRARFNRLPMITPLEITPKEQLEVPYHDLEGALPNLSTESGQLIVNKGTHAHTLLVSLYYNVFGPRFYYRLFSLGELGEGDKDTFVTAAMSTGEPYYQVKSHIHTLGFRDSDGFKGLGMGQVDPAEDYLKFQASTKHLHDKYAHKNLSMKEQEKILKSELDNPFGSTNNATIFAIHANIFKINPYSYMENSRIYDPANHRLKLRMYSKFSYKNSEGELVDFELNRWKLIKLAICTDQVKFASFVLENVEEVCSFINNTVEWLQKN